MDFSRWMPRLSSASVSTRLLYPDLHMHIPVTYLFVPGDRPERFAKALQSGADVVILDLEDAVMPEAKDRARAEVARFIQSQAGCVPRLVVRINDTTSKWFAADLELLRTTGILLAMLPKAETPAQVALVRRALPPAGQILLLIESARGVCDVDVLAATEGVARLVFGTLDYGLDLGLSGDERGLIYAATRMAIASRCAGLASPVAGVTPAIDDTPTLLADVAFARATGFGAKLCIHPRQVAPVRNAFAPDAVEIAWAKQVLVAATGTNGAVAVDGRMVDRPVLQKAQSILERAQYQTPENSIQNPSL